MGWSPIRRIVNPIRDVVEDVGDVIQDVVIDPVVELGSNLEDGLREVLDEVDNIVQNPVVQTVVSAVNPAAGAFLNAYATLDSGENLSPTQIAALAAAGYTTASGTSIPPEVEKALKAGEDIAKGSDPKSVLLRTYGSDFVSELGLDTRVEQTFSNTFGEDTANLLRDNIDVAEAGARIVAGEDPSSVIVDKFGQDIVDRMGVGDPAGFAALKTAVALDQGLDADDALLAGAEDYYRRGGQLPNFNEIATLTGIEDFNVGIPDLNIPIPELESLGLGLRDIANLGVDVSGVGLGNLFAGGFSIPEIQGLGVNVDIPDLEGLGFNIPQIADLGFDVSSLGLEGLEARGLTLPEIRNFGVDISGLQFPDLQARGFGLGDIGDLGFDIASMDFSGYTPGDLGDYSLPELKEMGVNLGDLDLNLELGGLGVALMGAEQQRQQLEEEEDLLEGMAQFQPEFSELEGPSFAREVLGRRFT